MTLPNRTHLASLGLFKHTSRQVFQRACGIASCRAESCVPLPSPAACTGCRVNQGFEKAAHFSGVRDLLRLLVALALHRGRVLAPDQATPGAHTPMSAHDLEGRGKCSCVARIHQLLLHFAI